jgi:hypothetical protein
MSLATSRLDQEQFRATFVNETAAEPAVRQEFETLVMPLREEDQTSLSLFVRVNFGKL